MFIFILKSNLNLKSKFVVEIEVAFEFSFKIAILISKKDSVPKPESLLKNPYLDFSFNSPLIKLFLNNLIKSNRIILYPRLNTLHQNSPYGRLDLLLFAKTKL